MNIIPPVSMVDAGMLDDGLDPKEALSSGMDFSTESVLTSMTKYCKI